MTGSAQGALAPSASVLASMPATGLQHAAWLLIAFPLLGAVVLLVGGRRTNAWGP